MDLGLAGLRAVVTGGSAGIGAAIARTLAAEGCSVFTCARHAAVELPAGVQCAQVDVRDAQALRAWLARIGDFDLYIANVSALSSDWDEALDLDVRATLAGIEAAIPALQRSAHAAITYIGSKAGSLAAPHSAAYGAAKAAMAHAMKSLALRLAPRVRVNVVSPGDTEGRFWGAVREQEPEAFARVLQRNPFGRLAEADEVARVATFVSSPAASFVSGANWYVDGASTAHVSF